MNISRKVTRRQGFGAIATVAGTALVGSSVGAADSTPIASPSSGEWSYTDVLGNTISLPERPKRIAAVLNVAAALWELGIHATAVFDWTSSAFPDGDHIAWGEIDVEAIANVGNIDGFIEPEALIESQPDIILTMRYTNTDDTELGGIEAGMLETLSAIAPVAVVIQVDPTDIELGRIGELARSLGADLDAPEIVEARTNFEAKIAEFQTTTADHAELSVIFASFDPAELYIAGPDGIGELTFMADNGLVFANADQPAAGDYWETLSVEQALKYPADIAYVDVYSTLKSIEDLLAHPSYGAMPSIAAGQLGNWLRDSPLTYTALTNFLEEVLIPIRAAEKVS